MLILEVREDFLGEDHFGAPVEDSVGEPSVDIGRHEGRIEGNRPVRGFGEVDSRPVAVVDLSLVPLLIHLGIVEPEPCTRLDLVECPCGNEYASAVRPGDLGAAFPRNVILDFEEDFDLLRAGLLVTVQELELHGILSDGVPRHDEGDLVVVAHGVQGHLLVADEDVLKHQEALALEGDGLSDMRLLGHRGDDDEGFVGEGDLLAGLHGLAVCELEHELSGNGSGAGPYYEAAVFEPEALFLAAEGYPGDEVEVGAGYGEGVACHECHGSYSGNGRMDERVSHLHCVAVGAGEGHVAFTCLCGHREADCALCIRKVDVSCTRQGNRAYDSEVTAAYREYISGLDG